MTNVYDFLRQILVDCENDGDDLHPRVPIRPADIEWIRLYLKPPEALLNFKATKVGEREDGEPINAMDFQIAGDGYEIFCMITEAMVNNYQFADIIQKAVGFYRDHIPACPHCSVKHFGPKPPALDWIFSHPKQQ